MCQLRLEEFVFHFSDTLVTIQKLHQGHGPLSDVEWLTQQ